ncbi:MAG: helix-turn-helix domain-containing protein [Chitinophagales bacterium]|nr:helix-turn-helix domain-containing protein [Chitinophagales bacterium]
MAKKMPTYSICNLLGADRCMTEIVVNRLRSYIDSHQDIQFPHRHDFYQIVLFTRGGGRHSIDFQQFDAAPHQVYYMAPGQIHTWDFNQDTDGYIVNFNESFFTSFCHNPHFVRDFPLFSSISGSSVNTLDMSCCGEVETTFAQMLEEFDKKEADYKMDMLRGMLSTILVRLSRVVPQPFNDGVSKHNLVLMRQFEILIEQHFREKRLPKEYAELMFVTPNHLNALSNSVVGKSAGELIRDRILLEAKRLLVNSDLMISQIAETLNFEDNAYFTRFFKKYLGVTPEGFRSGYAQATGLNP